tara:strand:- start:176 stop:508 length:333 start_codon:yes stop_codon:yes gene_type:complete
MKYVVTTQHLENYGAHCESGKHAEGHSYWKFKGGSDYIVDGVDRPADAMAFVMAAFAANSLGFKEFPTEVKTFEEWVNDLPEDQEYADFLKSNAYQVSPDTGRNVTKGVA